jgi:hypothetical protein
MIKKRLLLKVKATAWKPYLISKNLNPRKDKLTVRPYLRLK